MANKIRLGFVGANVRSNCAPTRRTSRRYWPARMSN